MTGSDDSRGSRPISVAELLAKNGTIGSPPVGGRRRRRRGNADAVSVAELTGEIPIIRTDDEPESAPVTAEVGEQAPAADDQSDEADTDAVPSAEDGLDDGATQTDGESETETEGETDEAVSAETEPTDSGAEVGGAAEGAQASAGDDDDYADAVAEDTAQLEEHRVEAAPVIGPKARRFGFGRQSSKKAQQVAKAQVVQKPVDPVGADAERMSPDPPDDGENTDVLDAQADLAAAPAPDELDDGAPDAVPDVGADAEDTDELPSYLRSAQEPLFGGQMVADDLVRRGGRQASGEVEPGGVEPLTEALDSEVEDADYGEPSRMSGFAHGLWIVGQSVFAVILGAALFFAFDQLWRWNNIIALVLSVLVILGLVVGVRVVRKTEDIGSTLIAVAVGALVTLGPLALLQSG